MKKPTRFRASQNAGAEPFPETAFEQRKPPENARFRLQVDRQTKASYPSREAAHEAGLAIKHAFPILHVTVFDAEQGQTETVALPAA